MSLTASSVAQATRTVKTQKSSASNGNLRVAEQGMGWFAVHIFRNNEHLKDWMTSQKRPVKIVPLSCVRGRCTTMGGDIDHLPETLGNRELAAMDTEAQR